MITANGRAQIQHTEPTDFEAPIYDELLAFLEAEARTNQKETEHVSGGNGGERREFASLPSVLHDEDEGVTEALGRDAELDADPESGITLEQFDQRIRDRRH